MAKPNYSHMKKQKEAARKARHQEKLTKKLQRGQTTDDGKPVDPKPDP